MKTTSIVMLNLLLITGLAAVCEAAGFNKSGRTAFQFVKIGVGARQVGLGETGTAGVRDANSVFWNPAGITGVESGEAAFSHTTWFADLKYYSGAAAVRWPGVAVFGVSYASLDYGSIQEALSSVPSGSADTRTGGTFTGGDVLVGFSVAREFTQELTIGATVKFLQEKLFAYDVKVAAYDIGTNYDVGYKGIRLGMSAQNFGQAVKWLEHSNRPEGYDIPLVFRIGTSVNLFAPGTDGFLDLGESHTLSVLLDAVHTNDYGDRLNLGAEYRFSKLLSLRAGYRFNYDEGNLSVGAGIQQSLGGVGFALDYSYVSYEFLESPHRLTLAVRF